MAPMRREIRFVIQHQCYWLKPQRTRGDSCACFSCRRVRQRNGHECSVSLPPITIPTSLLPSDGRFGCGPSRIQPAAVAALAEAASTYLGTSHRQPTVKAKVHDLLVGLQDLFQLPTGWEIVIGLGGSTVFWDVACFGLIHQRSQHLSFGEFSSKFAGCAQAAPFLADPSVILAPAGSHSVSIPEDGIDTYAQTHNETSTGVAMQLRRPRDSSGTPTDGLVLVDATSAAGGLRWDPAEVDVYYFAPQKCLASDGGLWLACCSPAALERIAAIKASGRWIPASLNLASCVENSRLDQTINTPALATVFLAEWQVRWVNEQGGLEWAASRCDESAALLYGWAEKSAAATPFVADPAQRSHVVGTVDIHDRIDANVLSSMLRANGIVDTESYRKLGRNQLRIAMFPATPPADVEALTCCIDYIVDRLG